MSAQNAPATRSKERSSKVVQVVPMATLLAVPGAKPSRWLAGTRSA